MIFDFVRENGLIIVGLCWLISALKNRKLREQVADLERKLRDSEKKS